MKPQTFQFFIVFLLACTLAVHSLGSMTKEQRERLSKEESYGAQEFGKHGYGQQDSGSEKKEVEYAVKGGGHDSASGYGTGHQGGQGSVHSGSKNGASGSGKKSRK